MAVKEIIKALLDWPNRGKTKGNGNPNQEKTVNEAWYLRGHYDITLCASCLKLGLGITKEEMHR